MDNQFLKSKSAIKKWLDRYQIGYYHFIHDEMYGYVVNCVAGVDVTSAKLKFIPVKFNTVEGNFNCSFNQLTSLEFCPQNVGWNFDCSYNKITSLEFCPQKVGDKFYCIGNPELKEIENIIEFDEIYKIHQQHIIKKIHDDLDSSLKIKSEKFNKIKIYLIR